MTGRESGAAAAGDRMRAVAVLLAALAQILAGYLPTLLDWQVTISDRSAALRTPLVPAGYAFAIWGPLFAWLLCLAVWHLLPRQLASPVLRRAGWWIALLLGLNALWEVYVPLRTLDWGSAIILLAALGIALGLSFFLKPLQSGRERWLLVYPLQALCGWLTAAFFANLSSSLSFGAPPWLDPIELPVALGLLALLFALSASVVLRLASYAYVLPLLWALVAVAVSNLTWSDQPLLAAAAGLSALLLLAFTLLARRRRALTRSRAGP